jgi:two-component system phosphate regulon response regulator PhoB
MQTSRVPAMELTMTVLLTAARPDFERAIRAIRPDIKTRVIGSHVPEQRIAGPLWCFVDWVLPDVSGLEMCRRLRVASATQHSHITMLLDVEDSDARRRALSAGADDYLVGPVNAARLVERIGIEVPKVGPVPGEELLSHGEIAIYPAAYQVRFKGALVALRPNEMRILTHFVHNPDRVISRTRLIAEIGKDCDSLDERTVDVWIGRLRRALAAHGAPNPIRTVRSVGYVLDSIRG